MKTVLTRKDTRLSKDIELSLERISRLGDIGVLEENEGKTGSLVDGLVSSLWCSGLVAESQPSVRWVKKTGGGTSLFCSFRLKSSNVVTLTSDTCDNWDLVVDGFDERFDDVDLFLLGQEGTFTGVAEDDETLDTLDGDEP